MFQNTTSWTAASEVKACLNSNCSIAGNEGTMVLEKSHTYTISTVGLQKYVSFSQWTSNAGSLASNSSSPTQFTPTQSGTLSLITVFAPPLPKGMSPDTGIGGGIGKVWLGYSDSACWPSCTSVSGQFRLPANTSNSVNVWVGIGGMANPATGNYTNLWQAGVNMTYSGGGQYTIWPWWEACTAGTGPCNSPVHYNKSFPMRTSDKILVWVKTGYPSSWFEIQDLSQPGNPTWSYTDSSFAAPTQYS